jgi:hypothetical protein
MLKTVVDSAGLDPPPEITVIDRCDTPLQLCRAFASKRKISLTLRRQNILERIDSPLFDAIFTHSFLGYFDPPECQRLFAQWYSMLRIGGRFVTVQRIRENFPVDRVRFTAAQAAEFVARVETRAAAYPSEFGAYDLVTLARRYTEKMDNRPVRAAGHLRHLIESTGFRLKTFEYSKGSGDGGVDGGTGGRTGR